MRLPELAKNLLASLLICSLASHAMAQTPPKLQILVVEGGDAINNVKSRTARETIVQVRDENDRPVAGAVVVFQLPGAGPSGLFRDGSRVLMTTANSKGQASAVLQPNSVEGQFQMRVTASSRGESVSVTVSMTNAFPAGAATKTSKGGLGAGMMTALVIGAAAAGAGVAFGMRGGNNDPARNQRGDIRPVTGVVTTP